MDYEKRYKEALSRAKGIIRYYKEHNRGDEAAIEDLEIIFPELKESEDERIRKSLIKHFREYESCAFDGLPSAKILDWLEKQGDACDMEYVFRPLAGDTIEKAAEQAVELYGKVVLAFNGAYIPVGNKTKDEIVAEYHNWVEKQGELKSSKWTEGDVVRHGGILALVTNGRRAMKSNCEQITIQYPNEWVKAEAKERKYFFDELEKQGVQKPTNDTDEDIVEAVKDASILDMVEPKDYSSIDPHFFKPTWSEDDDEHLRRAIKATKDVYPVTANWLKSLKQRMFVS